MPKALINREKLEEHMKLQGLTQKDLALRVSINPKTFSAYLKSNNFTVRQVFSIAEELRIEPEELWYDRVRGYANDIDPNEMKTNYLEKYIRLLEKREDEVSIRRIFEMLEFNQKLLIALYENLVDDSKKTRILNTAIQNAKSDLI